MPVVLLQRPRQAVDEPVFAIVVVFPEGAAGRQVRARGLHRLRREQVALEPER